MRVELYKIIKGQLVLVDYGVISKMESYAKQGYITVKTEIKEEKKIEILI